MQQLIDVLIMVVNYSHDTATAFLAVSVLAMGDLARRCPDPGDAELGSFYLRAYTRVTRMALAALGWILLTSLPRTFYYAEYEAFHAAGELQLIVILVMHGVMAVLLASGLYFWVLLTRRVKALKLRQRPA